MLFECRREAALPRKSDLGGDITDAFIRVLQKLRRSFHSVFVDVRGDGVAVFLFELGLERGGIYMKAFRELFNGYPFVHMRQHMIVDLRYYLLV